ncbi:metallopeptidase family protein [Naumannella sp. ID2617S]|nr:metallopeptidase family protein [Naumannella sp. ID2617S]
MSGHRDRHGRGLRGPLARPRPDGPAVPLDRTRNRTAFFAEAITESVARISRVCPEALVRVQIGWEEVPHLAVAWTGRQVPLALAVEETEDRPARVVLYRRPLEHRAATPTGLKILVHRTVVEQLAALTGLSVETIDPEGYSDDL